MAQYLPLPDGSSVTVREGETPQQAWARAQQMYPEAFQARQPQVKPEPTVGGQVKEFFKGILPGGIGALESAAVGASALLPEDYEKQARAGIASIAGAAKKPFEAAPGYEDTVARKFGEATGSIAPFLLTGPFGAAGRVAAAGLGMGMGAGEARTRAEQEGATAEQRSLATGLGSVVGISEMFAPARILGRIGEPVKTGVAAQLKRIALAGGEEAAQEAASQAAQNLIAKGIYKPEQEIIEQVGESAAYGGAVGALAQGLLDLALGRRAKGVTGTPDEIAKAREEANAQREELIRKRQDPAYAQEIETQYNTLEQQRLDLESQIKKGKKGEPLSTVDQESNKLVRKQIGELEKKLNPVAKEYAKVQATLARTAKDKEAADMTRYADLETQAAAEVPQEARQIPYGYQPQRALPGFEEVAATETKPTPEFVDYAGQIRNLEDRLDVLRTQAQQTPDLARKQELNNQYQKVQAAIKDAQRLASEQQKAEVPSDDAKIAKLRKRMAEAEDKGDLPTQAKLAQQLLDFGVTDLAKYDAAQAVKQAPLRTPEGAPVPGRPTGISEGKAEFAARVYKPGAPVVEEQEQEYLAEQERQRQATAEEAERQRRLLPETLPLKRMAERPTFAVGQGQISGMVDQLVDQFVKTDSTPTGKVVSGAGVERVSRGDSLRAQLSYALATDNRERALEIKEQLRNLNEPETETAAGDLDFASRAKRSGIEGSQGEGTMRANRITRLAQSQLTAFDRLADFIQTVRESDQNVAEGRKKVLRDAAERLKDITAGLALNEMDARRAQAGMAELTTEEKTRAAGRMNSILNEMITRGAGLFNTVTTPAVTRGTLTLKSAEEGAPPVGQRMFSNLAMAATSLRGQLRQVMDETVGVKAAPPRAPVVPRKAAEGLRMQFAGQERSTAQQFEAAKARATEDQRGTLEELETKFKNLTPEAQELALEQARNVELGKEMIVPGQLQQELADLRRAGESETGQGELFSGVSERGAFRATTNNFIRYLNTNEVFKMRQAVAEQRKQADFQAKRAATIQKKLDEETTKQVAMIDKLTQPWFDNPVAAARREFQNTVDKNKAASDLANEINGKRTVVRVRIGSMVQQVEDAHRKTTKNLKEVRELYDYVAQKFLTRPGVKKFQTGLEFYTKEVEKAEKAVATSQKALDAAKALQTKVLNDFAKDTIDNAIIREGQKADSNIERARLAVVKAQGQEDAAAARLRRLKDQTPARAREETAAEAVAKLPVTDVTKVYRDTSDPNVQAQVKDQKLTVAKWEAAHEAAQAAGDESAMERAVKNIENAYSKIYELYNNAPLKREVRMSDAQVRAQEDYERSQYNTVEALTKLFEEKTGAKLRMTKRKVEGVIKDTRTGAVRTAIKKQSLAQQEAQFKKEQESGEYAAKTLEDLANVRAKLKEVTDRIAYIDEHKAPPRTPARMRQNVARTQAVAERTRLEGEERRLKAVQKAVEQGAKAEKKATKALRSEKTSMLRAPGRLQEALDFTEDFEGLTEDALEFEGAELRPKARQATLAPPPFEVAYDGTPFAELPVEQQRALLAAMRYAQTNISPSIERRIENGLNRAKVTLRGSVELFTGDPASREKLARAQADLAALDALDPAKIEAALPAPKAAPAQKPVAQVTVSRQRLEDAAETNFNTQIDETAPFNGMTFAEAARYGAQRTTSPMVRQLFDRLAEVFDSAPVQEGNGRVYATQGLLQSDKGRFAGIYNTKMDVVYSIGSGARANKVLLHELTHAATVRAMQLDPSLAERMESLRQQTVAWLATPEGRKYFREHRMGLGRTPDTIYGLKNHKEFVSELFADREFQKLLAEIPSTKPRKSIFTRFVETLSQYFNMPGKAAQSLFAEAVALTEEVLNTTKTQVYEGATPTGGFAQDLAPATAEYVNDDWANASKNIDRFVAKNKSWIDKVKANTTGLAFETQIVDRFAGFERLRKYLPEHLGTQMMYYLRMYDQRMNMVSQAVEKGAPQFVEKIRADGNKEYLIEAKQGPSIKNVVQILREAQPMVGNGEAVNRAFTMYMAAIRAGNKGFDSLNFGEDVTPDMLQETQKLVEATPGLEKIFNNARDEYNAYNRNLIQFVADSGAISQETADSLLEENDYIPFYRERNGVAELIIGNEAPIRIGSIKEQPHLEELVGGDQPILDFMTSSVQNTNMLLDMGMRNIATKNAVFELLDLGAAKFVKKADGPNVVQFKDDGETKYAVLSTEKVRIGNKEFDTGVPADILIKGMEGIPTQMPLLVRAMAVPAQLLRKSVTLSPLYMARQLFRDSLAAPLLSGADFTPVIGALRQIGKPTKDILERRGITGGQQFTGSAQDISKILRDISDGKSGWMEALGKFEAMGMEADALTRRAQYNSYIEQGMSEMEATLMSLESMNFNKRGASPSVHWANALIPFFNAQIQGLNVLYKAMSGKMPFNDKLRIREKLLQRGSMMAVASIAYALAMQDDEAYQNATPDQKYANWFVRVPGMDEPIRVPIPFEIGYIFKALPEALVNTMSTERGGEEALKALRQIVLQSIPGGSNYGIPQALKPAIEAGLGKSFYTGRDILSQREANLLPEEQFRANTTDVAKLLGKLGISPIVFENLVRGYTGTMGIAFLQALSLGVPKGESPEQATRRLSEYPVVGGAWQPNDAGGIANSAYERMNDVKKLENTINKMVEEGRTAEAMALMTKRGNEYMQAELGDSFRSNMQELTRAERAIQASAMTPQQKREQLDEIRKLKTALAKTTLEVADKTIRLSSQP